MRCLYVFLVWNKDLLNLSSARIFMYLLKILYSNSANMSLGHLCKQIHPIAFPEFPLHMQKKVLRMVSLIFYKLQNTFKKILATDWTVSGDRITMVAKFTAPVRTGPVATQPPVQWVPCLSRKVKSDQDVKLTPHPFLVPWSWKGRAIPLLPLWALRLVQSLSVCTRVHFNFFLTKNLHFSQTGEK